MNGGEAVFLQKIATDADVANDGLYFLPEIGDAMTCKVLFWHFLELPNLPFDVAPGTSGPNADANTVTANSITTVTANAAMLCFTMLEDNRNHTDTFLVHQLLPNPLAEQFDEQFNGSRLSIWNRGGIGR